MAFPSFSMAPPLVVLVEVIASFTNTTTMSIAQNNQDMTDVEKIAAAIRLADKQKKAEKNSCCLSGCLILFILFIFFVTVSQFSENSSYDSSYSSSYSSSIAEPKENEVISECRNRLLDYLRQQGFTVDAWNLYGRVVGIAPDGSKQLRMYQDTVGNQFHIRISFDKNTSFRILYLIHNEIELEQYKNIVF